MCDIEPLIEFNVFATNPNNEKFTLSQTCQNVHTPFEQYCLIPPITRLQATSTCNSDLLDPLNADFIFPQIMEGKVRTLEDLPVLYVSFPVQTGDQATHVWIRDDETLKPNEIFNFASFLYNGFRPVSPAPFVTRMAVSAVEFQKFLL